MLAAPALAHQNLLNLGPPQILWTQDIKNSMNLWAQKYYEHQAEPKGPRTFSAALESLWTQNTRSFVNLRPQNIYEPETTVFLLKHKTPRNWWAWTQDTKTIPQA